MLSVRFVRHRPTHWCLAALLLAAVVFSGCVTRPQATVSLAAIPAAQRDRAQRNLAVFNTVWDLVNRKHYLPKTDGVDWEKVAAEFGPAAAAAPDEASLYAVLNEMLDRLRDSHTHALTPAQALERQTRERARTGFSMTRVEHRWVVADVVAGSPAAGAGVSPGWIVERLNGQPLGDRPDFRPREGEVVHWEFIDPNDRAREVAIPAKRLSTAALQVERDLPGGYVYLRFDEFDVTDRRWLGEQLKKHAAATGVVIDLRRNPGGETFSLGITIGEFFDRSVDCGTFVTRSGVGAVKNSWQLGSAHYRGKVAVLVDGSTASAAEIFAAVLKDHRRATIVGRKTAGAVLASWFYRLPDGGQLQLSRENYLTPEGHQIEGNGVDPDVVVNRTLDDLRRGRDPDLETALALLRGEGPAK